MSDLRIGQGFDVHGIKAGDYVTLGGIQIESPFSLAGFSDADVLTHALTDAMLGALALGDIGVHFPPGVKENKDRNSLEFLAYAQELVKKEGYTLSNADCTVICEKPKIAPYAGQIQEQLAKILEVHHNQISIKGTTTEKLGFTGRGEGIAAQAIVLLRAI